MSIKTLRGTRTRYRTIIQTEIDFAKTLVIVNLACIDEESTVNLKRDVRKCLNRIFEFYEKLENVNKEFMSHLENFEDANELDTIIDENCLLDSDVIDCKNDLQDFEKQLIAESDTSVNRSFEQMLEFQKQMQKMMISHQENTNKQQQEFFRELMNREPTSAVKLPALDLPSFSGEILKWIEFWDSFESSVHCNSKLSPVEKLSYLNSKLLEKRSLPYPDYQYQTRTIQLLLIY